MSDELARFVAKCGGWAMLYLTEESFESFVISELTELFGCPVERAGEDPDETGLTTFELNGTGDPSVGIGPAWAACGIHVPDGQLEAMRAVVKAAFEGICDDRMTVVTQAEREVKDAEESAAEAELDRPSANHG